MASTTFVRARVDSELKAGATTVLEAIGLDIPTATRLMLARIVADQGLPAGLLVPNETTLAAIREARDGKLHSAASFDDLMAQLNAAD